MRLVAASTSWSPPFRHANGDRPFNSKQDATAGRAGQKRHGWRAPDFDGYSNGSALPGPRVGPPAWRPRGDRHGGAGFMADHGSRELKTPGVYAPVLHCPRAPQHWTRSA
jgi:hypothetical protein